MGEETLNRHVLTCLLRMCAQIGVRATMFNRTCGGLKRLAVCQTNMLDTCARGRWDGSLSRVVEAFQAEATCLKFVHSKVVALPRGEIVRTA